MSKTPSVPELRTRADALHQRYVANYAGHPRVTRDAGALERMAVEAEQLYAALQRFPEGQRGDLGRALRNNRKLYQDEAKAIRQAQAGGVEGLYAHHLATWASVTGGRYRRHFAGRNRATRDLGLLGEMITDLERYIPLMEDQLTRVNSDELSQALEAGRANLALYKEELGAIRAARGSGTLEQQADVLASVANGQFTLYRDHFAGKSRVSRRPALMERMMASLVVVHDRMKALKAQGLAGESNDKNISVVAGRVAAWQQELEAIRESKSKADLGGLVAALGQAANAVFDEYREHFAGKDRRTRDRDQLSVLTDRLIDLARQMDDLDRVRDDETNRANLGIVLDNIRMYSQEYDAIRDAQEA